MVNPGGPGVSGIQYAQNSEFYFNKPILDRYDIVGWDPRGVGTSAAIECMTDEETDAYLAADGTPDTPAEVQRFCNCNAPSPAGVRRTRENSSATWEPSTPRGTSTSFARRSERDGPTTSGLPTARNWARPMQSYFRRGSAGWCSTVRSTRPCPRSNWPSDSCADFSAPHLPSSTTASPVRVAPSGRLLPRQRSRLSTCSSVSMQRRSPAILVEPLLRHWQRQG